MSNSELVSLRLKCSNTNKISTYKPTEIEFECNVSPCDLCGDHTSQKITYKCKDCKTKPKYARTEKDTWHEIVLQDN